jgi:hypothetical protein
MPSYAPRLFALVADTAEVFIECISKRSGLGWKQIGQRVVCRLRDRRVGRYPRGRWRESRITLPFVEDGIHRVEDGDVNDGHRTAGTTRSELLAEHAVFSGRHGRVIDAGRIDGDPIPVHDAGAQIERRRPATAFGFGHRCAVLKWCGLHDGLCLRPGTRTCERRVLGTPEAFEASADALCEGEGSDGHGDQHQRQTGSEPSVSNLHLRLSLVLGRRSPSTRLSRRLRANRLGGTMGMYDSVGRPHWQDRRHVASGRNLTKIESAGGDRAVLFSFEKVQSVNHPVHGAVWSNRGRKRRFKAARTRRPLNTGRVTPLCCSTSRPVNCDCDVEVW